MGHKSSSTWDSIHVICRIRHVDEKALYVKAKKILKIYQSVGWMIGRWNDEIGYSDLRSCDIDFQYALAYLESFPPDVEQNSFLDEIGSIFETDWMLKLIKSVMQKVKEYPRYGDCYYELIQKKYFSKHRYTETEILEVMGLERSCYYDKHREAIMVFGIALWEMIIPQMKQRLIRETMV